MAGFAHETSSETIDFIEKRGSYAPIDLSFNDENGRAVTLKEIMGKRPAVLTLVYFHCSEACNPLLNNIAEALANLKIDPNGFVVITVSISPEEGPKDARQKKNDFMYTFKKPFPESSWRFLTGSGNHIRKLADATGYSFRKEEDDYVHPLGVVFLAPDGKITRYLRGTFFLPFDFQMGLMEASQGKVGSPMVRAFSICYGYDPAAGKYVLNATRIGMGGSILFAAAFLMFLFMTGKRKVKKEQAPENTAAAGQEP